MRDRFLGSIVAVVLALSHVSRRRGSLARESRPGLARRPSSPLGHRALRALLLFFLHRCLDEGQRELGVPQCFLVFVEGGEDNTHIKSRLRRA